MESSSADQNIVNHSGNMIALSFFLFAITFLLVFNTAEYDLGLFIGFVGIIIFISQRKYINPDIKRYVYSGIIIFILSLIASSVYIAISLSSAVGSIAKYQHGNEIAGKYLFQYFFNYYFYSSAILVIVDLISYILISYKFLIGHKLPFIAGLIVSSALDILYTDVYLLSLKGTIGNEMINVNKIAYYESQIKYAGDAGNVLIIRLASVLISMGLFIYLGIYIRKNAKNFVKE